MKRSDMAMLAARIPPALGQKRGPTVGSRKGHDAGIRRRERQLGVGRGRDSRSQKKLPPLAGLPATPTPVQREAELSSSSNRQSLELVRFAASIGKPLAMTGGFSSSGSVAIGLERNCDVRKSNRALSRCTKGQKLGMAFEAIA